ncbi:Na(+)/H(+) antiporter subunit C [Streptomyces sp. NPDC048389]|uniref:Na(+)/H(+) antiporter subunit C n=1 Tax=Streptomyces sp. NPDC048389 TaxID=3154622 RepID=UPI0034532D0D
MNPLDLTMAVVVGGLYALGFYLMLQRSLMRIVLGFLVLGHGTNLLLLVAGGSPGKPPIIGDEAVEPEQFADPLLQAMALTSIVITFGLTTFLLALAFRSWRLSGHDEVRDDIEDRRIGTVRERADDDRAGGGHGGGAATGAAGSDRRPRQHDHTTDEPGESP